MNSQLTTEKARRESSMEKNLNGDGSVNDDEDARIKRQCRWPWQRSVSVDLYPVCMRLKVKLGVKLKQGKLVVHILIMRMILNVRLMRIVQKV
ncbi:hypothetical protein P8452_47439 [Trifolium repens]|nr:hypothetical protein P8452_47439 [Trifolium repens]